MDNKINLVYFAFSEEYGAKHAGFVHASSVTKCLGKYCNKVDVLFSYDKIGFIESFDNVNFHGVIVPSTKHIFKVFSFFKSYFYIKRISKNASIIHERFHVNPIDLLFVNKKPYVLEMNDPAMIIYSGFKNWFYNKLISLKLNNVNTVITQTETLKKILSKFTNKNISVISNGVDTKLFSNINNTNMRKKYNLTNKDILVVFVGSFMQWHGVQDIVKLAERFNNVKFMLIGNGPLFSEIKERSNDVKNIILVGSKDHEEIPKYLNSADILIAPFNTDRFKKLRDLGFWWCPIKLFEYMASGKPIVSYDYSEVRNIVCDSALLAKTNDLEDFGNKLKILIENKDLRNKLSIKARYLSKKFSWDIVAKKTMEVYYGTIKNR